MLIFHRAAEDWGIVWVTLPCYAVQARKLAGLYCDSNDAFDASIRSIEDHIEDSLHALMTASCCFKDNGCSQDLALMGT